MPTIRDLSRLAATCGALIVAVCTTGCTPSPGQAATAVGEHVMIPERLHPRRQLTRWLIWATTLFAAAIIVNMIGIRMVGNPDTWQRWMADHADYFFAWRLALYTGTAYGWWRMHRRLRQREPAGGAYHRLVRAEIAAGLALVALEASLLWQ